MSLFKKKNKQKDVREDIEETDKEDKCRSVTVFDIPWRPLDFGQKKNMKENIRRFKISIPDIIKHLRILVHGPVGAGKSSFINSIDSLCQDRITSMAIAEAATGHSFTRTFQTYYIKDQNYGTSLPFALCDIMGLEDGRSEGVETDDLIKVLQGHIEDGYTFNPTSPASVEHPRYNKNPMLKDRIHCLVSVIPANKISIMEDAVIDKMRTVRATAGLQGIPQVVVLTKVDDTCTFVTEDIKLVYKSKKIKEKMQECSNRLGVPMSYIFPVKCYHEEIQLNDEVDVLLLSALTFILNFANDHVAVKASSPNVNSNEHVAAPPAGNMSDSSSDHHAARARDHVKDDVAERGGATAVEYANTAKMEPTSADHIKDHVPGIYEEVGPTKVDPSSTPAQSPPPLPPRTHRK